MSNQIYTAFLRGTNCTRPPVLPPATNSDDLKTSLLNYLKTTNIELYRPNDCLNNMLDISYLVSMFSSPSPASLSP